MPFFFFLNEKQCFVFKNILNFFFQFFFFKIKKKVFKKYFQCFFQKKIFKCFFKKCFFKKFFFHKMLFQKMFFKLSYLFKCDMMTKENCHTIKMSHQTEIIGSILFCIVIPRLILKEKFF